MKEDDVSSKEFLHSTKNKDDAFIPEEKKRSGNFGEDTLTKFVDKHQRMFGGMLQNGARFTQLNIKRTLTGHYIVIRS